MNCRDCQTRLDDLVDGALEPADARAVEAHLSACAGCRLEHEALERLRGGTGRLPRSLAPARDLWPAIAAEIRAAPASIHPAPGRGKVIGWFAPLAVAASIVLIAVVAERRFNRANSGVAWTVSALAGAPRVDAREVRREADFRLGQWLVTDDTARAKVTVGSIGEVKVEPNSRLRLTGIRATEHRLQLSEGTLEALIYAPPRLFFVDTPSATAVDLGCMYTLTVGPGGDSELRVTAGFVSLEDRGRSAIVRWGMTCLTRKGHGPGTPYMNEAPAPLRAALARFDFEPAQAGAALHEILSLTGPDDTVTLWHLLTRTEGAQREAVFNELTKHVPLPNGVTRAGILAGDKAMHESWGLQFGLRRF